MADVHLRMSDSQKAKLDAISERAGVTISVMVRRLIDAAAQDIPISATRLTESELLDLMHEQARTGRTAAIAYLLRREDQEDSVDRLLSEFLGSD